MTRQRTKNSGQEGYALVYMAATMTVLLLFTGLAVDTGRGYVVKAQLTKAVDGAALAAARNLNSGDPQAEAARIFKANFPSGYMLTSAVTDPTSDPGFFNLVTDEATGVHIVTVTASAVMPTSFMKLANFDSVTVTASGEATRRMVDLSLVIDVSSSLGSRWAAVRDAARAFVAAFDGASDRFSLTIYSWGGRVLFQMPSSRGFDKAGLIAAIPQNLPGGGTAMAEGLYRGWDEIRAVPNGSQSSLRVIVLFTDGAANSVPGLHDMSGTAKGLMTMDFPYYPAAIRGLHESESWVASPNYNQPVANWMNPTTIPAIPYLPTESTHQHHRSLSIPTSFPLQTSALTVDGVAQNSLTRRGLLDYDASAGLYPAHVRNISNAARNLVEIIANEVRSDTDGDYRIRIYTLGMGDLIRFPLGTMPEISEDLLKRVANDPSSPDYNSDQLEGKYFFAQTEDDVGPAFQGIQNQILRLSK
jgi:Flp pilus assembly protein TadG